MITSVYPYHKNDEIESLNLSRYLFVGILGNNVGDLSDTQFNKALRKQSY